MWTPLQYFETLSHPEDFDGYFGQDATQAAIEGGYSGTPNRRQIEDQGEAREETHDRPLASSQN